MSEIVTPLYLYDTNHVAWLLGCYNNGMISTTASASPSTPPVTQLLLADSSILSPIVWSITVSTGGILSTTATGYSIASYPTQQIVTAPNSVAYAISVGQGFLQTSFPSPTGLTTIGTLANQVQERLEETVGAPGVFWSLQYEIYSALVEAMNDLMLLVGRPTQIVQTPFTLAANSAWQTIPKGVFIPTDLYNSAGRIRRVDLNSMDFTQSSWTGSWQNDTSATGPVRWGPIGVNRFFVHPAPTTALTISMTAISLPVAEEWPYGGSEGVPFSDEFFVALEEYAALYCRIKENEITDAMPMYGNYLNLARRMSQIQDRRDGQLFASPSLGLVAGLNPVPKT